MSRGLELDPNKFYVGKEVIVCKCGTRTTGRKREWEHLTPPQKRAYFISEGMIAMLLVFPCLGAVEALLEGKSAWLGAGYGLLIALAITGVVWAVKAVVIHRSLQRCPRQGEVREVSR